jgi:hypothetical protein
LGDVFDAIGQDKAKIFSTLDLAAWYWKVEFNEKLFSSLPMHGL